MGQLGDLSPQGSIAIGVLVGLISTSLQAIGLTLQRKSHILEDEKYPYDIRRPPYKRTRWQLGMSMFVLSNIVGSTIQITTLPLPVLSALQASGLVFNTIFATLILGEPFTRYSFGGTVLVCVGAVLIAIFGAIGEPAHTLDQLLELLSRPAFLRWVAGTAVIVVATLFGSRVLKGPSTSGRTSGWKFWKKSPKSYTAHHYHHHHSPRIKTLRGILYGAVSGILSAHSLLVAKTAVELLVRTILDRVNQFNRWQSWVILLGLVALALTQLYYMHRGLKLCSTSILYPFVFCIYNIIAILDGLIYFHQASRLSGLHAGLIALGTVILLSGVLCLSWRLEEAPGHPEPGPAPSALAPGLGILDEQATSPTYADFISPSDEESYAAERQPLLVQTPIHQRTPSRLYTSTFSRTSPRHRHSINLTNEAEQIWADLYDESNTINGKPPRSPTSLHRQHHHRHQRSSSGAASLPPNQSPPMPGRGGKSIKWKGVLQNGLGSRSRPHHTRNVWRRASTPVVVAEENPQGHRTVVHRDVGANASVRAGENILSASPGMTGGSETQGLFERSGDEQSSARSTWLGRLFRRR
ncbi:conserved hypothetical protein [Uncinocarpus reesii 1704]|uniref:DUF803 domain-containing protein n=1 Tax=Uncinocarpus reesii (strain UAMH 1704) TaxID=336963 RepID=C4JPD0_UNCRE|nr:uncharacterized protein UREG_04512 [Uncinocarpus reesii 1704]EEP79666.1 conserved hypothetical protein [Uncinocarpus reesii 1704]